MYESRAYPERISPQAVSQAATGLAPNSLYRVKLVTTKVLGPTNLATSTSAETLLLTAKAVPTATTRPVHAYTDTSAWIVGDVNPNGESATYFFEWGPTASYGKFAAVPAQSAGSGSKALP